ncbi:hypothetical protein KIPB_007352 [Kipferlia bialata]|uniref:ZZ-type domain-containing protein n=1 Tax=Kipferlia bialata TaxID=797122 RepID=A0A9K3GJ03_9EUKA|nr:hypothetical protein KIPB_007352 [Kipferlia bialata]|eukprot:g7352.t1
MSREPAHLTFSLDEIGVRLGVPVTSLPVTLRPSALQVHLVLEGIESPRDRLRMLICALGMGSLDHETYSLTGTARHALHNLLSTRLPSAVDIPYIQTLTPATQEVLRVALVSHNAHPLPTPSLGHVGVLECLAGYRAGTLEFAITSLAQSYTERSLGQGREREKRETGRERRGGRGKGRRSRVKSTLAVPKAGKTERERERMTSQAERQKALREWKEREERERERQRERLGDGRPEPLSERDSAKRILSEALRVLESVSSERELDRRVGLQQLVWRGGRRVPSSSRVLGPISKCDECRSRMSGVGWRCVTCGALDVCEYCKPHHDPLHSMYPIPLPLLWCTLPLADIDASYREGDTEQAAVVYPCGFTTTELQYVLETLLPERGIGNWDGIAACLNAGVEMDGQTRLCRTWLHVEAFFKYYVLPEFLQQKSSPSQPLDVATGIDMARPLLGIPGPVMREREQHRYRDHRSGTEHLSQGVALSLSQGNSQPREEVTDERERERLQDACLAIAVMDVPKYRGASEVADESECIGGLDVTEGDIRVRALQRFAGIVRYTLSAVPDPMPTVLPPASTDTATYQPPPPTSEPLSAFLSGNWLKRLQTLTGRPGSDDTRRLQKARHRAKKGASQTSKTRLLELQAEVRARVLARRELLGDSHQTLCDRARRGVWGGGKGLRLGPRRETDTSVWVARPHLLSEPVVAEVSEGSVTVAPMASVSEGRDSGGVDTTRVEIPSQTAQPAVGSPPSIEGVVSEAPQESGDTDMIGDGEAGVVSATTVAMGDVDQSTETALGTPVIPGAHVASAERSAAVCREADDMDGVTETASSIPEDTEVAESHGVSSATVHHTDTSGDTGTRTDVSTSSDGTDALLSAAQTPTSTRTLDQVPKADTSTVESVLEVARPVDAVPPTNATSIEVPPVGVVHVDTTHTMGGATATRVDTPAETEGHSVPTEYTTAGAVEDVAVVMVDSEVVTAAAPVTPVSVPAVPVPSLAVTRTGSVPVLVTNSVTSPDVTGTDTTSGVGGDSSTTQTAFSQGMLVGDGQQSSGPVHTQSVSSGVSLSESVSVTLGETSPHTLGDDGINVTGGHHPSLSGTTAHRADTPLHTLANVVAAAPSDPYNLSHLLSAEGEEVGEDSDHASSTDVDATQTQSEASSTPDTHVPVLSMGQAIDPLSLISQQDRESLRRTLQTGAPGPGSESATDSVHTQSAHSAHGTHPPQTPVTPHWDRAAGFMAAFLAGQDSDSETDSETENVASTDTAPISLSAAGVPTVVEGIPQTAGTVLNQRPCAPSGHIPAPITDRVPGGIPGQGGEGQSIGDNTPVSPVTVPVTERVETIGDVVIVPAETPSRPTRLAPGAIPESMLLRTPQTDRLFPLQPRERLGRVISPGGPDTVFETEGDVDMEGVSFSSGVSISSGRPSPTQQGAVLSLFDVDTERDTEREGIVGTEVLVQGLEIGDGLAEVQRFLDRRREREVSQRLSSRRSMAEPSLSLDVSGGVESGDVEADSLLSPVADTAPTLEVRVDVEGETVPVYDLSALSSTAYTGDHIASEQDQQRDREREMERVRLATISAAREGDRAGIVGQAQHIPETVTVEPLPTDTATSVPSRAPTTRAQHRELQREWERQRAREKGGVYRERRVRARRRTYREREREEERERETAAEEDQVLTQLMTQYTQHSQHTQNA